MPAYQQYPLYPPSQYAPTTQPAYIPSTAPMWPQTTYTTSAQPTSPIPTKMTGMYGHFVNSASEITPNEVPMDGSYAIFPLHDFSKIFIKSWNTDGTISTLEFSPVGNSEKSSDASAQMDLILEKLSKIEQQLS